MSTTSDHRFQGQAGVYRVASELSLRHVGVYFPSVDTGVDLITSTGKRLQVRAATIRNRSQPHLGLGYYLSLGWGQRGSKQRAVRRPRKYSEEVDVFVIWGVDEDRFWICPANVLDGGQGLLLRPGKKEPKINKGFAMSVYKYEGRWDLITENPRLPVSNPLPAYAAIVNNEPVGLVMGAADQFRCFD
jgi:hypothetical protein